MAVLVTQHIEAMKGGAQGHLMLGADEQFYVVKFQGNPQSSRVLANELLATRLATAVGLTVPPCEVVEVTPWLIKTTPELCFKLAHSEEPCGAGLQFGSRFVGGVMPGQAVDYLPEPILMEVRNLAEFAGMLLVDKWTCNVNGRQAVFARKGREKKYTAIFIDQGFCFNGKAWTFHDIALRGVFPRNAVYAYVTGWESFEPWLSRIERMDESVAWGIAELVPPEWYGGDVSEMERLLEKLLKRRSLVRELVEEFKQSDREPFPNWGKRPQDVRWVTFVETESEIEGRVQ